MDFTGETQTSSGSKMRSALLMPQAALLARQGHCKEAANLLRALTAEEPLAETYCLLGKVSAQMNDYPGAVEAFRESLLLDSQTKGAAAGLAKVQELMESGPPRSIYRKQLTAGAMVIGLLCFMGGWGWVEKTHTIPYAPPVHAEDSEKILATSALENPMPMPSERKADLDLDLFNVYAKAISDLQDLSVDNNLVFVPKVDKDSFIIGIHGTVPSDYMKNQVAQFQMVEKMFNIDVTELKVNHRYKVRNGDSLAEISNLVYGKSNQWNELFIQNREAITKPDMIHPGTVLMVP